MDLTRNSFVASALDDARTGRTRLLNTVDLIADTPADAPADEPADAAGTLTDRGTYAVTDTFRSLWESLSLPSHARLTAVAVMRGILIEPRHPAYRVTDTGIDTVYQSQVGDAVTLVFTMNLATSATSPSAAPQPGDIVWLAVLRTL